MNQLKTLLPAVQSRLHPLMHVELARFVAEANDLNAVLGRYAQMLQEYSARSGKAVRPLLVAAGAAWSLGQPIEQVLDDPRVQRLMLMVELNHQRILMADDVADRDEQRHDGPSFHVAVEQQLAHHSTYQSLSTAERQHIARSYTEVMGIALQQWVNHLLVRDQLFSSEEGLTLSEDFVHLTYNRTVAGWFSLFEQNYEELRSTAESRAAFLQGLEQVTGEYTFISPLLWGATLGSRRSELESLIRAYGEPAGVLFQLSDDVIGLYGDPAVTGKPVGNDLREGKKTLFVQYAWEKANSGDQKRLAGLLGKSDITAVEMQWVKDLIERTGAVVRVRGELERVRDQATEALANQTGQVPDLLREVVVYLMDRQK